MGVSTATRFAAADSSATAGRIGILRFLSIVGQLAVLFVIIRQFAVESPAFLQVTALAFLGFVIHAFLPLRYRLLFFLVLSLSGIALVFGIVDGLTLIAVGLTLIGACHLPLPFGYRIAVLLLLGAGLAALRANWLPAIWSEAIWPILGSMFMFRLIVYLYYLKHDNAPITPVRTLSYFFMLPNVCFPLFPVIDYKTFCRNYFDEDAYGTYQVGIDWMVRGVIHLLLYRYVYYYLTLSPAEVKDAGDLIQFMLTSFLLYLRVSGLFHLIVGMLYLFGFRLPETHHRYYLASSVSDLWRRINIYWKDFMLRIFYYPMVFQLRHLGATQAMVLATLFVFVMTWFLHAYQWFWLRGTALLEWQDILFWVILGALVVVNGLREIKHGRERSLGKRSWTWHSLSRRAFNTVLTFSFICVLWSFWTSGSMAAWLSMWTVVADNSTAPGEPPSALLFAALGLTLVQGAGGPVRPSRWSRWLDKRFLTAGSLAVLLIAGIEDVHSKIGGEFSTVITTLRSGQLSRLDQAQLERGYYEGLLSSRSNSQLWEIYAKKPVRWLSVEGTGLKRFTNTFVQTENTPSFVAQTDFGPYSINRWGMRDKDYEKQRPANTFRAALLGASTIAGWGAGDGETFEAIVEDRLNKELAGSPYDKYEILNFGVPGYQPPQQLPTLERALTFDPTVVFYVATGREATRAANYLADVVRKEIEIPYAPLKEIVTKAGLTPTTEETVALRNLDPFKAEILGWVYRHITEEARAHGAVPFFFFLPQATEGAWQTETPMILESAKAAGFEMIDLADVFKGHPVESYTLAEWDRHPNAFGHQLIATRIYDEIGARQDLMFGRQ